MVELNGKYIERIALEGGMSGLNKGMKYLAMPFIGVFLLSGLSQFYIAHNLNGGYSNPETKNKFHLFCNVKKELDSLENSKNNLLAKCYFPFYSGLNTEESKNLSGLDKKIALLDKNKSKIKEDMLKNDKLLYSNYFSGNFLGSYLCLAAVLSSLFFLRHYFVQKKEIIKEAKEDRAYWDSMTGGK